MEFGNARDRRVGAPTVALLAVTVAGCGGTDGGPTETGPQAAAPAVLPWSIDGDNFGDGRDVTVGVALPDDEAGIAEYRAFLIVFDQSASFDENAASAAAPHSMISVSPGSGLDRITFDESTTDTDGAPVHDGGTYAVRVLSVAPSSGYTSTLSAASPAVTLARTNLVKTLAGPIPIGTGGVDVDVDGNVYLADFGASLDGPPGTTVRRWSGSGTPITWAQGLVGASGNAFGSDGSLYQSNISAGRISRIASNGSVSTFAEGLQGGPVGIAITPGDTLFVVNCGRDQIQRVAPDGTVSIFVQSALFHCPNGITLADDGNFYVANFNGGDLLRVSPTGAVTRVATLPGNNLGHVLFGNGVLYVVARGAHQIYQVTLDGEATLLAGSGTRGARDGAALDARLSLTNDVGLSPDGTRLYFNDVAATSGSERVISPTLLRVVLLEGGA